MRHNRAWCYWGWRMGDEPKVRSGWEGGGGGIFVPIELYVSQKGLAR